MDRKETAQQLDAILDAEEAESATENDATGKKSIVHQQNQLHLLTGINKAYTQRAKLSYTRLQQLKKDAVNKFADAYFDETAVIKKTQRETGKSNCKLLFLS